MIAAFFTHTQWALAPSSNLDCTNRPFALAKQRVYLDVDKQYFEQEVWFLSLQLGNWRRSRELDNAALRLRLGTPLILHRFFFITHPLRAVGVQRTDSLQAASGAQADGRRLTRPSGVSSSPLQSTSSEHWGHRTSIHSSTSSPTTRAVCVSHTEERRGEVLTTENNSTEMKKENICA